MEKFKYIWRAAGRNLPFQNVEAALSGRWDCIRLGRDEAEPKSSV